MASGVDQNGGTSKLELARDALLDLVGGLEIGTAIPSERRLATQLGISRPTLRMAIDELVREGLLLRRHGSGTYVAEPKIALPLTMTSFSEDMRQRGMRPGSRVLSFEEASAGAKLGARLRVSPADRVWVIRRLRLADGETSASRRGSRGVTSRATRSTTCSPSATTPSSSRGRRPSSRPSRMRRRPRSWGCRCTPRPSCSSGPARVREGRWWSSSVRSIAVIGIGS